MRRVPRRAAAATLVGTLLCAGSLWLYLPVWSFELLDFDDLDMVLRNPLVRDGLQWRGFLRSIGETFEGHWIPLTWFSFFLERVLFGEAPGVFHGTNALLHGSNVVLLFLLVRRLTGTLWPGAFVAALLAVHPLHVESVAWVVERKDVLALFFGLGALHAYVSWARRPSPARGLAAALAFVLSLASKPMLVPLPLLLLLLDYWPLGRFRRASVRALVAEKVPLLAIALGFAALAVAAQRPMLTNLEAVSLATRASYALVAPLFYLGKLVWPSGLGLLYPVRAQPYPVWVIALAPGIAAVATWLAVRERERRPWLMTGWLWYLVLLAPVSGIAQAGISVVADRLVYGPALGIYLLLAFSGRDLIGRDRRGRWAAAVAALLVLLLLAGLCRRQIGFWRDGRTAFERVLEIAPDHWAPYAQLVGWWIKAGDLPKALEMAEAGHRRRPVAGSETYNLGHVLDLLGRHEEAREYYLLAIEQGFRTAQSYGALGTVEGRLGRYEEAVEHLEQSRLLAPKLSGGAFSLGLALVGLGRLDEAVLQFREAVELDPGNRKARFNLARALWETGRVDEAADRFEETIRMWPDLGEAHRLLGLVREAQGRRFEAEAAFRRALAVDPADDRARAGLERVLRGEGP